MRGQRERYGGWERGRGGRTSSLWHGHTDIRVYQGLPSRRHNRISRSVDVIAGCEGAAAGWETGFGAEFFDEERGLGGEVCYCWSGCDIRYRGGHAAGVGGGGGGGD